MGILLACSPNQPGGNSQTGDDTTSITGNDGDGDGSAEGGTSTATAAGTDGQTGDVTSSGSTSSADTTADTTSESSGSESSGTPSSETAPVDDDDEEVPSESSESNGDAGSTGMDCPSAEVTFTPQIPTVLLLIDQSGSMTTRFGRQSRWDAVRDALTAEEGVIDSLQGQVRFGLALYTSHNGSLSGNICPILTEVPPAIDNLAAISAVYDEAEPEEETPTGDAIFVVTESLSAFSEPGPKVIVLATDGEPDTCAEPNPQRGQALAIEAVEAAYAAGIRTYVIAVGNEIGQEHLQDIANAGAGWQDGDPLVPFYQPADQAAMIETFSSIVQDVRECVLTLDGAILPGQEDRGTVTINGDVVPFNDPDGWRVNSPSEIELTGAACELIQGGNVDVRVEFTCEALVPS